MIRSRGDQDSSVYILTSDFHLRRALIPARRAGYPDIYGEGADVPALYALRIWTREIGAYWKLAIRSIIEKIRFRNR